MEDRGDEPVRVARQAFGLSTIAVVLALALGESFLGVPVPPGRLTLLVALAGGLLGLDAARDLGE